MSDSNSSQKSGIPGLKKPGTGIPSRLPTVSSSIRKSTSVTANIENPRSSTSSLASSSTSSIPQSKIPAVTKSTSKNEQKEAEDPNSSRSSLSSTSSTSIPNLSRISSGSTKNVSKPGIKEGEEKTKPEPKDKSSKLAVPSSVKKPEVKADTKADAKPDLKQEVVQETKCDSSNAEIVNLKKEIKDLSEKLETLKIKRAEDREKIRENDKLKLQYQQLQEYKIQAQEMISQLNKEMQQIKQENKNVKEEFVAYKEEMSSFESRIEELTVDKELAEARAEELEEQLDQVNSKFEETKLELDVLKGEIEINGPEGVNNLYQNEQLENYKLALYKLSDLHKQEKNNSNNLGKKNEELSQKLAKISRELEVYMDEKETMLAQINELNEQVTASLGSEQIIERLSERNLDLESRVNKLEEDIADLEAINEVNDQLQDNAREEERELRQNLDLAESRIRESERQIEQLKYNIADHEKTIVKFRELVKQLQSENESISKQLKTKLEEEQESMNNASNNSGSGQNFDFKHKYFENQIQSKTIENEVNAIELQSTKNHVSFLLSFMSDSFIKQSGNNEGIMSLVFFRRIASKCDLLLNYFKEKITKLNAEENGSKVNQIGQLSFFYNLSVYSSRLRLFCNKFDHILNNCDLKSFHNIGSMFFDFSLNEKHLDSIIDLVQKNQLDENISLDGLEKMCSIFQNIINNHLREENFDHHRFLEDTVRYAIFSTELMTLEIQKITSLAEAKDDSSEIYLLFKEIMCKNDELKASLKKAQRNLPNRDDQKKILTLPSDFLTDLDNLIENLSLVCQTFNQIYHLASNSKMFSSSDDFEPLVGKKLENFAYQACDKVYVKDDNGPYENLRNSLRLISQALMRTSSCVENADYETELSDEEFKIRKYQINSPIQKAAEQFKNTLIEAENIKLRLEEKEDEIKEIKKNLKLKVDELSEQKLRISIVEKKAETQLKELEEKNKKLGDEVEDLKSQSSKKEKEQSDAVESLQQQLATLDKERREMKDKLRKKSINESLMNLANLPNSESLYSFNQLGSNEANNMKSQSSRADSSVLAQEISVLKCQNRLLMKSLNEAKQAYVNRLLNDLPDKNYTADFGMVVKNTDEKHRNFVNLTKKTNDLLKDVYSSFASVKIGDLGSRTCGKIDQNKLEEKNIYMQMSRIEKKLTSLQKELNRSGEKDKIVNLKRNLVAEISVPNIDKKNSNKIIDLNVNLDELRQIMAKF
ncbi:dynactin subunit 1 isoform X4 [Brachionus plicatilis]|uniref:Dynactin subunit 1 isoform X4 n=1 Tax=Brachionus plicatilis TaxID=10195 RepID=A0A3M7S9T9_BRAPC|nr:dynactin subunit 1 isoform X4 [Brachionus plicatilis]